MLKKYNAKNVRLIRSFIEFLDKGEALSDATITGAKRALKAFQQSTRYADFATFDKQQAIAFKEYILAQGKSKSTLLHYMNDLKRFFEWLAYEKGYRSKIDIRDTKYFRLNRKEVKAIKAETYKPFATFEQMQKVIRAMPCETIVQKRNRALVALCFATGARDKALSTAKMQHIYINQDPPLFSQVPKTMSTKGSKYIHAYFITVIGQDIIGFFVDYYKELKETLLFGNDDPLFPKTLLVQDQNCNYTAQGLSKELWSNADPIRKIFKQAFEAVGLPYYPPHRVRKTLTQFAEQNCRTPEEFKAFSQNIGHESVMTTFVSYGEISHHRQEELIRQLGHNKAKADNGNDDLSEMKAMMAKILEKQG